MYRPLPAPRQWPNSVVMTMEGIVAYIPSHHGQAFPDQCGRHVMRLRPFISKGKKRS